MAQKNFRAARLDMVMRQLTTRDIHDPQVLGAMETVPREHFVPRALIDAAYQDRPLPIGNGQTISQPYIVAKMIQALEPREDQRVLEIGGGSGYAAAVLSRIVKEVWVVEREERLARDAEQRLSEVGYRNVRIRVGDGTRGWSEAAPYHGILISAAATELPPPLLSQLAPAGRLVAPLVLGPDQQQLVQVQRQADGEFEHQLLDPVRFVPLIADEVAKKEGDQ
jgi:protein-L-isoaspartate(D-aspartate) O-methyltransferase